MPHLVSFRSTRFDVAAETPNPINPIAGHGVLGWLRGELAKAQYASTEPAAEDWGWYINVEGGGTSYMVGASGDAESSSPAVEWIIQVHKHRSVTDKLLGRQQMAVDDPLVALIDRIVRADPQSSEVAVDSEA